MGSLPQTVPAMILRLPRRAALVTIAVLIAVTALASFAQSYRGLYEWASEHGLHGAWAYAWPVQVDTFIAVGELALFVALVDRWPFRSRIAAWVVTGIGLLVSVAGNVGHVTGHSWWVRGTAAVPPVAAAAALAVGLGILKRIVEQQPSEDPGTVPDVPPPGAVPATTLTAAETWFRETVRVGNAASVNKLREQFPMPRGAATEIRRSVLAETNGHGE